MSAELLMQVGGIGAFVLTVYWVRSRDLREKYAIVWLLVACLLLISGLFPSLIMTVANLAHLGYSSAVLFITLTAIYLFSFTVSVSLSRQHRHHVRLMQEIAILEQRVRELEMEVGSVEPSRGGTSLAA